VNDEAVKNGFVQFAYQGERRIDMKICTFFKYFKFKKMKCVIVKIIIT
jgi:hypothetical protein